MNTKQMSYVVEDWGLIGYLEAYQRQKDLVNRVIAGELVPRDALIELMTRPLRSEF